MTYFNKKTLFTVLNIITYTFLSVVLTMPLTTVLNFRSQRTAPQEIIIVNQLLDLYSDKTLPLALYLDICYPDKIISKIASSEFFEP